MIIFSVLLVTAIILVIFLIISSTRPESTEQGEKGQNNNSIFEEFQNTIVSLRKELEQKNSECSSAKRDLEIFRKQQEVLEAEISKQKKLYQEFSQKAVGIKNKTDSLKNQPKGISDNSFLTNKADLSTDKANLSADEEAPYILRSEEHTSELQSH